MRWARLSIDPVTRLSRHTTWWSISINRSQRWLPRNPAPPVISTRMIALLSSFDKRMAVPEALVPFGPPLLHSGPSPLKPVAPHRPPPLAAKVRHVLCWIRFGFSVLDGVLRDHPKVVDEGGSGQSRLDLSLLRPPEEVHVLASSVDEPFIKQPDRVEHHAPHQHARSKKSRPSRRPAGRREFRGIAVQFVIKRPFAHGWADDAASGFLHEAQQRRQPSRGYDAIIAQDPNHVSFTGLDALVPGLGASKIVRIANDRDADAVQVLQRAVGGGIVHDDDFTRFVRQAQHGLQTLHGMEKLIAHGNDETDAR